MLRTRFLIWSRLLFQIRALGLACFAIATLTGARLPPTRPGATTLPPPRASEPSHPLEDARRLLGEAERGSATAADQAVGILRGLLMREPAHAQARALLGVAIILQARDAPMLEKKQIAAQGFAEIDAAVRQAPQDPQVRLVRATNASQMPLFLGRREIAMEDFRWLIGRANAPVGVEVSNRIPAPLVREVFFRAGSFAVRERLAEAVPLLERALETPAPTPSDETIQSVLALARRRLTSP